MTDEQKATLLAVVRQAIEVTLKYPFAPLQEREQCLRVALAALDTIDEQAASAAPAQEPEQLPDTSQEWARLSGAVAFHLIERHGEDWNDIGAKMEAWGKARFAAPSATHPA